jgi:Fur family ferric uptake transcriptional regulator
MACEENFVRELRERGFRLTPQREMVLLAMHEVEGLATADEIYGQVRERSTAVDISTVYRTLDLLQEFKMVVCIDPGDGQHHYELLGLHGPHVHLVCQRCGTLIGIEREVVQPLADRLLAEHGFALDLDGLALAGVCPVCQRTATQAS